MKVEMTIEKLEEMVLCIVHNGLSCEDAVEYAKEFAFEQVEGEIDDC